jgi:predicted phosphodiesterase
MQVAVLSDIHANRHALEAVLDDVERTGARELWCLGDLVGYGADPNDCVEMIRGSVAICIAGNHDMAVTGELSLEDFSRGAAVAASWTKDVIRPEHLEYLATLRPLLEDSEISLYHGSPRDPVWEYVVGALLAELCLDRLPGRIGLVGHSHVALSFNRLEGSPATGEARRDGETVDISEGSWLLNPGSVGQPRDGDPRAAWMLLDLTAGTATWRRVAYDVLGAQAAIREARLPDSLAERLGYGQ